MYCIINLNKNYHLISHYFVDNFQNLKKAYRSIFIALHILGVVVGLVISILSSDPITGKLIVCLLILILLSLLRLFQHPH